jgi:hypothetical protein
MIINCNFLAQTYQIDLKYADAPPVNLLVERVSKSMYGEKQAAIAIIRRTRCV